MNAEMQALSDAEDRELIVRLTPSTAAEIATAIRVVQRINYGAAYGRDPKLCAATNETLGALRTANVEFSGEGKRSLTDSAGTQGYASWDKNE